MDEKVPIFQEKPVVAHPGPVSIDADDAFCTRWAQLRADARASGHALSPQDAWIAAAALGLGAPLATNNQADFLHIPGLQLLSV